MKLWSAVTSFIGEVRATKSNSTATAYESDLKRLAHRALPREDVREPDVLRGSTHRYGGARRAVRSAPGAGARSGPPARRAAGTAEPDIRAGIALVIAALCAEGRTVIRSVEQIDRGYEDLDAKLQALGARVNRVKV